MKRVRAEILSTRTLGAYRSLTLVAPELAERARPGQFVAVAMPPGRDFILRRHLTIHQSSRRGGWAGTLEFVVDPAAGPGTAWLADLRAHESLDVIGPLGKPFAYPKRLTNCLLVGEGRSVAGLYFLAQELIARGKRVDMVIGAATQESVFKPIEAKRLSQLVTVMTDDGTLGERGSIIDALPDAMDRCGAEVVYAAGRPRCCERWRRSVARGSCRPRSPSRRMGCGYGLCGTCAVPVARKDGTGWDHARACVDGPVFNPARIVWDRWPTAAASADVEETGRRCDPAQALSCGRSGGLVLTTPVLIASGCAGTGRELAGLVELRKVGGIVTRPITVEPRPGSAPPRVAETRSGIVWNTGRQNPGIDAFIGAELPSWAKVGTPLIVSVGGGSLEEYVRVTSALQGQPGVHGIEIDLSGPDEELERPMLGAHVERVTEIVGAVARMSLVPVFAKMPGGLDVVPIAIAAARAGATGLTLTGSPPAYAIDTSSMRTTLGAGAGWLSGPALNPSRCARSPTSRAPCRGCRCLRAVASPRQRMRSKRCWRARPRCRSASRR